MEASASLRAPEQTLETYQRPGNRRRKISEQIEAHTGVSGMNKGRSDHSAESDYMRGYLQGTLDALQSTDAPFHPELWDCATMNLTEWRHRNGTLARRARCSLPDDIKR